MTMKDAIELIKELPDNQPAFALDEVKDNEKSVCIIGLETSFKPTTLLMGGENNTGLDKMTLVTLISREDFLYMRVNADDGNLQFYYEEGEEPQLQAHMW